MSERVFLSLTVDTKSFISLLDSEKFPSLENIKEPYTRAYNINCDFLLKNDNFLVRVAKLPHVSTIVMNSRFIFPASFKYNSFLFKSSLFKNSGPKYL